MEIYGWTTFVSGFRLLQCVAGLVFFTALLKRIFGPWVIPFLFICVLKYTRLVWHLYARACLDVDVPHNFSLHQQFNQEDVTVILPAFDPMGDDFRESVCAILINRPHTLCVVTVGHANYQRCKEVVHTVALEFRSNRRAETHLMIQAVPAVSSSPQFTKAIPSIQTEITVIADQRQRWGRWFLNQAAAPFDSPEVGAVAVPKRVMPCEARNFWESALNFVASTYFENQNWDLYASYAIDGGAFVTSDRAVAYRTKFLQGNNLLARVCQDRYHRSLSPHQTGFEPDNFDSLVREVLKEGSRIVFWDTFLTTIEVGLGELPNSWGQLLRWVRATSQNSHPVLIRDVKSLKKYPWSCFMAYVDGMGGLSVLLKTAVDVALRLCLFKLTHPILAGICLMGCSAVTEAIRIFSNVLYCPSDDPQMLIFHYVLRYVRRFFQLYDVLTFQDIYLLDSSSTATVESELTNERTALLD